MAVDVTGLANTILGEAAKGATATWQKIQEASKIYVTSYAQALAQTAEAVAAGEITPEKGVEYAKNAQLLLEMGLANSAQITLNEVQQFINKVLGIVKGAINAKLPVPLL